MPTEQEEYKTTAQKYGFKEEEVQQCHDWLMDGNDKFDLATLVLDLFGREGITGLLEEIESTKQTILRGHNGQD